MRYSSTIKYLLGRTHDLPFLGFIVIITECFLAELTAFYAIWKKNIPTLLFEIFHFLLTNLVFERVYICSCNSRMKGILCYIFVWKRQKKYVLGTHIVTSNLQLLLSDNFSFLSQIQALVAIVARFTYKSRNRWLAFQDI